MAQPLIHPGEILSGDLQEIGITPTELARQIKVPANRITQIMQSRSNITGDAVLRLGRWFGALARFWPNLQRAYEIRITQAKLGRKIAKLPVRREPAGVGIL